MCLGIPGRVVAVVPGYAGQLALVDVAGGERRVNVGMLDDPPGPGDWVLIHMGFAVELIDAARAAEAMSGLELMGRPADGRSRRRFAVAGLVQGVGFRPFAYATASALALSGSVANTGDGVVIEVEGDPAAVVEFGRRLRADACRIRCGRLRPAHAAGRENRTSRDRDDQGPGCESAWTRPPPCPAGFGRRP